VEEIINVMAIAVVDARERQPIGERVKAIAQAD